jgi:DNA repair exonuclease SbcCD ATPase subunit
MPFLTMSTLLLMAGVFTGGCLVAWWVNDRKHERARELLEESMTRALEARYHVYQDLEQSFHRLFSSLDDMRDQWQEPVVIQPEQSMPEHNLMRVDNPELWDLEREYERRYAEALAEVAQKGQRVTELMDQVEELEPTALKQAELEAQMGQMEDNQRALEETRQARVVELNQRIAELEPLQDEVVEMRSHLERAVGDVTEWRNKHESLVLSSTEEKALLAQEVEDLGRRMGELQESQRSVEEAAHEKIASLESQIREREEQVAETQGRVDELTSEVESKESQLFMRDELVAERDKQVADMSEELQRTSTERDSRLEELQAAQNEVARLEAQWQAATGEGEEMRSKLLSNLSHFEAAHSMLSQLKPMLEQLEDKLTVEVDEPAAALPAEQVSEPVSEPMEMVEAVGDSAEEFDLSVLDMDVEPDSPEKS